MSLYSMKTLIHTTFEHFIEILTTELFKEGFTVLSVVDVRKALKENSLNGLMKYEVISVIHPFLYKEIVKDFPGFILPCQITVHEHGKTSVEVMAVNSLNMLSVAAKNPTLQNISDEITRRLDITIANATNNIRSAKMQSTS